MAKVRYESGEQDGATAIAHELDVKAALANASAKLLSVKNAGVEKLVVDKDGNVISTGGNNTWVVLPSAGSAGVQAAVNAAGIAGGGIIQLLKGTYTFTATVNTDAFYTWPSPSPIIIQGVGEETIIDVQEGAAAFRMSGIQMSNVAINPVSVGDTSVQIKSPGSYSLAQYAVANDYLGIYYDNGTTPTYYACEPNQVLTTGNPGTGVIPLKFPAKKATSSSFATYAFANRGQSHMIRNMKLKYSGTSNLTGFITFQCFGGVIENITIDGGQDGKVLAALSLSNGARNIVRNCRFYNIGYGVGYDTLPLISETESIVENCHFQRIRSARILVACYGSTRCQFKNNTFFDVADYGVGTSAYGATDLLIEGNVIEKCKYTGVYVDNCDGVTVIGNHIKESGNGIGVYSNSPGVISDNLITRCGYDTVGNGTGIGVSGTAPYFARNITISGNSIKDCASPGVGITVGGSSCTIVGNTIQNAGTSAAISVNGFNFVISDNSIYGSAYGVLLQLCKKVSITGNMIRGATTYGMFLSAYGYERMEDIIIANNFIDAGLDDALAEAIIIANELRTDLISHLGNATRHTTGQQSSAGMVAATDLTSLKTLVGAQLTMYAAHNADAILASGWAYHDAQATDQSLVSAVAPTTLAECYTRLIDMRTKYNAHELLTVGHATVASIVTDQVFASLSAYSPTAIGIYINGQEPSPVRLSITGNLIKDTTSTGIYATLDDSVITSNWSPNANVLVGTGNVIGLNKE